jgi:Ni,Fe-hydrogenase III large subunit
MRPVDAAGWRALGEALASGARDLVSLWADGTEVRLATLRRDPVALEVVALRTEAGRFPSIGAVHPPALRLERMLRETTGLVPEGHPDPRPWLDHGRWPLRRPLGDRAAHDGTPDPYPFLPVEGASLHEIPVGPVHAGIIEPGHFRFTAQGETVARLEARLGWVHKGIEASLAGAELDRARRIVGRVSGDATVAWQWAFARAVETIAGAPPPPRAVLLRGLAAELERVANHLGDVGAICNDAAFAVLHAACGIAREQVLQVAAAAFGHRLMMDRVIPGGMAADLAPRAAERVRDLVAMLRPVVDEITRVYDETPSLLDRTQTTGVIRPEHARRWAAGGFVGRASGRDHDTRRDLAYPPYDTLRFEVPVLEAGDVDARVRIRTAEIAQSLSLIEQLLDRLQPGPVAVPVAARDGEAVASVESFRGDVVVALRIAEGRVARCHPRDPSWFHWPLLEAAIEGNIVADFPLCNKSVNASYAGCDL